MQGTLIRRLFSPEHLVGKEHRLGDLPSGRDAYADVMRIAFPSIVEMVLMSLIGSVDTMMVGNYLGAGALSSVGLPTQPRMLLLCLFFALNVGVTAIVARRKGEERQAEANATLRNALMLALGLSIVMTAIAVVWAEPLMRLAGGDAAEDEKIFRDAVDYFVIMTYALPVNALSMCICAAQRGIGKTRITMWVNMAGNLINVFFNYCLIGGNLGFPRLEVRGAAIASVIGMETGFLMALLTVVAGGRHKGYLHLSRHDRWRFDKDSLRSILRVGGNAAVEQLGMRFGFFMYARIMFSLGTVMYAAHQICMQLLNITFTFGDGLGVAATALVGQNLGRKRHDLSILYGKICQRYAVLISLILGVLIIAFRRELVAWFIGRDTVDAGQVIDHAARTMLVLALVQPFQTSSVVLSGSLRGAGDNLYVALVGTVCVSVVRPIMTVAAVYWLHLDLMGAWIFGLFEIVLRFAFFYPRFAGGTWKDRKV
ncbi:MAG: MATE family efflux transporter [Clostridiales bacterium]|nr:MATE family efflux transporter [Clostridiales bacterium]